MDVERFFRGITHKVDIVFEEHLSHKRMINFLKKFAQNKPNFHISGPDFEDATLEEDIEEVEYDGVLTPSEEENHTWKLGLEQLIVLKDWQDKYYSFAKGPGVYRLNYDGIIRKLESALEDDFVIREISLVRESKHYSTDYLAISYILNIDDVVSDDTHSFTLVSLDVNNLASIVCKWDEPQHSSYIQESFNKLDSICKLEEMLGLGDYTKNKMEKMVECFKNSTKEITEDVEETAYEDEPIYCVTISVGTDETVMCYLLNEELKLRLINNGLLDGYYIDEMGMGNLLAVDWLYFVSSTPETSVMHNQIIIPALQTGTVGQRNLLLYMKPEQLRFVTQFPRKLITHWPMNEDIEEDEWEISHLIHNNRNSYSETKTWTLDDKALKLLEELQAEFPTSLLSRFNFKRLMERYDSFSLTRVTIEDGDLFHYYDIHYKLNYYDSTHVWGDGSDHLAFMRLTDFKQVATNNVINKDKHFEVTGTLITALERADVLEELEKTLGIEEFTKTKLEEATAEIEKLVANNNAKYQKIKEDIEEEPYEDKFMSLINLQVISDYTADHLDGGGWIWKDYGIIVADNPMGGPYIAGLFKATDDPNKFIRYDLDSIPEDILSDKELSYMNPEETDIDEYVPNLLYALEAKDNPTITDIINKIEANANQETMTLKAALNFIDAYWGTDEELDSWIKDAQEFNLNNANYLNIVEKLNEDIEEEPYSDSSASADVTLIKTAYDTHNDERYWIWEMPADVLCDISNKYDTHNYRRLDQRIWDFKSLAADPDYSWRIKRVVTDEGSHYTSNHRLIYMADISYQYYGYCKPDHETLTERYALLPYLRFSTGKQFDEEDLATLDKIRELDALLGVPEKYGIDNLIEQINGGSLDLYEDVNEEPIDIDTSSDNIIEVTKYDSFYGGKYKYRMIYYDINLDKTELVDYLLDLYMGLHLENDDPEEEIEEDIKLIRDRKKGCILYIEYKPKDNYSLGIYDPDYNYTLGLAKMPKNIAEKIIGDKLVADADLLRDPINEDIEEEKPEYKNSNDNIQEVTKIKDSLSGKFKYIYYDINLNKTELVNYLLNLYEDLQLENQEEPTRIKSDVNLIKNRVAGCLLYLVYKPSQATYLLAIFNPDRRNTLLGVKVDDEFAEKIIGDKLVTDNLEEDIEEVPPTEKDFLPEYSSKYLNWDKNTEGRKKSIEIINNHWNEKIWFLTVGGREADVYTPRRYMTFGEAYNDFVTYDKFADTEYLDNFIELNVKGFVLSPSELQKRYSCILFRACNEPEYVPDMNVADINEDIEEIPQQSDINADPISNRYIYNLFNNYTTCNCNEDVKNIVARDRDKKRWYVEYAASIWDDEEVITKELVTFDEAFKIFLDLPLDSRTNSFALICTELTEEEKPIINRGNTIDPFYITSDRFEKYLQYLGETLLPY